MQGDPHGPQASTQAHPAAPDRRRVSRARRQIEPVAGRQRDVALIGVEHDRPLETEQHLVPVVVVPSVRLPGPVAPRARRRTARRLEDGERLGAGRRPRRDRRAHWTSLRPCCGRHALARELHPLAVPGLTREPAHLQRTVSRRLDPALQHPRRRLRVLGDEVALERHQRPRAPPRGSGPRERRSSVRRRSRTHRLLVTAGCCRAFGREPPRAWSRACGAP